MNPSQARRTPSRRAWLRLAWPLVAPTAFFPGAALAREPAPPTGEIVAVSDIPGFAADDHVAALNAFLASCAVELPSAQPWPALVRACRTARATEGTDAAARHFFATAFVAHRVGQPAFFTGYYEPVVEGALAPSAQFATPLLAAPTGLVVAAPGVALPGVDAGLRAALRRPDGSLAALPERRAIEAGALNGIARPLVWLRDPVDAFFVQVQGSARIRLADGSLRRLAYAGRNGYPYTAIAKLLVQRLGIPPASLDMAGLRSWLEQHGTGPDEEGGRLMAQNRSYIFFRFDDARSAHRGPVGAEGVGLTPLRSLAVDRASWPYGVPMVIDAALPWRDEALTPFRRLLVAQDTGSGIKGAARADIFFGTGAAAAAAAGRIRHGGTLYVLWPKSATEATRRPAP